MSCDRVVSWSKVLSCFSFGLLAVNLHGRGVSPYSPDEEKSGVSRRCDGRYVIKLGFWRGGVGLGETPAEYT